MFYYITAMEITASRYKTEGVETSIPSMLVVTQDVQFLTFARGISLDVYKVLDKCFLGTSVKLFTNLWQAGY